MSTGILGTGVLGMVDTSLLGTHGFAMLMIMMILLSHSSGHKTSR